MSVCWCTDLHLVGHDAARRLRCAPNCYPPEVADLRDSRQWRTCPNLLSTSPGLEPNGWFNLPHPIGDEVPAMLMSFARSLGDPNTPPPQPPEVPPNPADPLPDPPRPEPDLPPGVPEPTPPIRQQRLRGLRRFVEMRLADRSAHWLSDPVHRQWPMAQRHNCRHTSRNKLGRLSSVPWASVCGQSANLEVGRRFSAAFRRAGAHGQLR